MLERLNRLAESIELLEGDNRSIREQENHDVTSMRDMMDSLNAESRNIVERIDSIDQLNTRFVLNVKNHGYSTRPEFGATCAISGSWQGHNVTTLI